MGEGLGLRVWGKGCRVLDLKVQLSVFFVCCFVCEALDLAS